MFGLKSRIERLEEKVKTLSNQNKKMRLQIDILIKNPKYKINDQVVIDGRVYTVEDYIYDECFFYSIPSYMFSNNMIEHIDVIDSREDVKKFEIEK